MRWANILRLRLRSLFLRRRVEDDLDEEMRYHLERQIDEEVAAGKSREEAHHAARRSIAGFEQRKEECRDARKLNLLSAAEQDIRYAVRQLAHNPGFTTTALLVLALGMCAGVAIFAFVDAALIQPLPYRDPARLVGVYESTPQFPQGNLSYLDYLDWQKRNNVFQSLDAYKNTGFILATSEGAKPVMAARVSAAFFSTLGVRPSLGRAFHQGEDLAGVSRTVMLSYAAWQQHFGGARNIIGKSITLDDASYLVIGVLPRDFHFAPTRSAGFWATLDPAGSCEKRRSCHNLYGVARLKDGVTTETATADSKTIARRLEKEYPDSNRGQSASVLPLAEAIIGNVRPILVVLQSAAALLLLIAYINTASLLLVRSESRTREIAIRTALGAGQTRLTLQFVTEGLVLVLASTAAGLVASHFAIQLLKKLLPADMLASMPYLQGLGLHPHVLFFAALLALVAVILFTITPVLRFSWSGMRRGLHEGNRGAVGLTWRRLGSKLVALELATAVVLCVGAGLLGRSLHNLLTVDLGFDADHLATMSVVAPPNRYLKSSQRLALMRQLVSTVSSLPDVESVATTSVLPVSFNGNTDWIRFVGRPYNGRHNEVNERDVSSEYLKTLRAPLLRGRYFSDAEDMSKPRVMIINQAFARKYFAGQDPLGKQVGNVQLAPDSIRTIIGVVGDVREGSLDSEVWPAEYLPANQDPDNGCALVVRTSHSPQSNLAAIAAAARKVDAGIVTLDELAMDQRIQDSPSAYLHRSAAWLVSSFATIALLLGVVGLYGVISYSVGQRRREIGVRMALGAEPASVYRLIFGEVTWLVIAGAAAGVACSFACVQFMRGLLFGVHAWDLPTIASVLTILIAAAFLASYLPARRAASVNPVEALRFE